MRKPKRIYPALDSQAVKSMTAVLWQILSGLLAQSSLITA